MVHLRFLDPPNNIDFNNHASALGPYFLSVTLWVGPRDAYVSNKLAKLGDAIAISKSETITDPLIHPLTDRGRCYEMLSHLKNSFRLKNTLFREKLPKFRSELGKSSQAVIFVRADGYSGLFMRLARSTLSKFDRV